MHASGAALCPCTPSYSTCAKVSSSSSYSSFRDDNISHPVCFTMLLQGQRRDDFKNAGKTMDTYTLETLSCCSTKQRMVVWRAIRKNHSGKMHLPQHPHGTRSRARGTRSVILRVSMGRSVALGVFCAHSCLLA